MGFFRKYGRLIAFVLGLLLAASGLSAGWFRFYYLGPMHHFVDPRWRIAHSDREY